MSYTDHTDQLLKTLTEAQAEGTRLVLENRELRNRYADLVHKFVESVNKRGEVLEREEKLIEANRRLNEETVKVEINNCKLGAKIRKLETEAQLHLAELRVTESMADDILKANDAHRETISRLETEVADLREQLYQQMETIQEYQTANLDMCFNEKYDPNGQPW